MESLQFMALFLLPILVLVAIAVLAIRLVQGRSHNQGEKETGHLSQAVILRNSILNILMIGAGVSGFYAFIALVGQFTNDASSALIGYVVIAVILLGVGLVLRGTTGQFLMVMGVIMLLPVAGIVFSDFGELGGLLVVLGAFITLIAVAVHVGKKGESHAG